MGSIREIPTRSIVPRGIKIASQSISGLVVGLVQNAEVDPGRGVGFVELYGTDVGLYGVEGLALLLVQDAAKN